MILSLKVLPALCWNSGMYSWQLVWTACLSLDAPPSYPADHQALWHRHSAHTGQTPSPHHADHGLCAAAVSEEGQPSENRPGKRLRCAFLAGIFKTDDGRELSPEPTGWPFSANGPGGGPSWLNLLIEFISKSNSFYICIFEEVCEYSCSRIFSFKHKAWVWDLFWICSAMLTRILQKKSDQVVLMRLSRCRYWLHVNTNAVLSHYFQDSQWTQKGEDAQVAYVKWHRHCIYPCIASGMLQMAAWLFMILTQYKSRIDGCYTFCPCS